MNSESLADNEFLTESEPFVESGVLTETESLTDLQLLEEIQDQNTDLSAPEVDAPVIDSLQTPSGSGSVVVSQEYLDAEEGVVETVEESASLIASIQEPSAEEVARRAALEQTEFGRILETSADLTGRITAFRALTKLWDVELPDQLFLPMCEEAKVKGLNCVFVSDWDQLLRFNRPAVLVIRHGNQLHRVVVEAVNGDAVEVGVGESIYRIPTQELQSRWQGNDGVLVWKPSQAGSDFMQQGDRSPLLPIARDYMNRALQLSELPLLNSTLSEEFDTDLTQKALTLQQAYGILSDGKIGNETYLLLNELVQPDVVRVLRRREL